MIYSNSKLVLKVKCFVLFEKPSRSFPNLGVNDGFILISV
ncbi:hypothetical protein NEISUBOT_04979 [Neisseria subflava NJ9703]|uniref:Uncharacterized protein n=1 Tax=Neisseria subflava NJ9703 TaxID=546268 RepID=A0A9W5MYP5_NEISU|nr:hypothetical protein NEISUBOT_04979 [Neisseria subflava NJ9703]